MSVGIHVVYVRRGRIVPDGEVPNSAASPSVKDYLKLEAADGFVANHWHARNEELSDTIVSYKVHDVNNE